MFIVLIKVSFSKVKADHHESKPWITVIAEKVSASQN